MNATVFFVTFRMKLTLKSDWYGFIWINLENSDVDHLSIVHEGFLGEQEHRVIEDYDVHWKDKGIQSSEIAIYQPDPDGSGEAKYVYCIWNYSSAYCSIYKKGS
jgi:hypothetical protein